MTIMITPFLTGAMSRLCTLVPSMARLVVSCLAGALLHRIWSAASAPTTLPGTEPSKFDDHRQDGPNDGVQAGFAR